jgi:hypothetical protein
MNTWERGSPAVSRRSGAAAIGNSRKKASRKLITGLVLAETKSSSEQQPSLKSRINEKGDYVIMVIKNE